MHKLMEYICDELEELERKADKEGKLSAAEMQYVDLLAHTKKNLLKAEEMMGEDEYSMDGGSYARNSSYGNSSYRDGRGGNSNRGGRSSYGMSSYARGRGRNAQRDSMGRYANEQGYSGDQQMIEELREMMGEAPDDRTRQEFQKFIQKIEQM